MTYAAFMAGATELKATPPGSIRRLVSAIYRALEKSARRRALHAIPDHLLKDIGIYRSDIEAIVDDAVEGRLDLTRRHQRHSR